MPPLPRRIFSSTLPRPTRISKLLLGVTREPQLFHSRNSMFNVWRNLFNGLWLANFRMGITSRIRNWAGLPHRHDPDDVAAQHVLQEKQAQNHHPNPIQGPAQNAKASGVSVIGTEHAPERLAPPATQKTSSSEKGLSDLSRQDHFPLVAPPTSAAKASMPINAPAPETQVESTPEPTGETKPSDRTPQHYPSQEIDNPLKPVPRQPVIVCDHDPSTDDAVAVSDPATRLSRLCDDSVILRRSKFYTADPLSSQDEPIPILTRTEVFQQLRDFYNQLHHVEPPSNMAPRRRGRPPGSKRNYFATAKTVKTRSSHSLPSSVSNA
ncbi:hypothetical protein K2173_015147 [Erythroxylum novogranatense]|uniref:Uncharacterized protein n=1 Tax=Erythroxylum novogranatense TaxID=1862640 RepID=A0AAV8T139_9ROSI|nr:hypothetical protein K2173_015147 [Erythroxylum novogranatense]